MWNLSYMGSVGAWVVVAGLVGLGSAAWAEQGTPQAAGAQANTAAGFDVSLRGPIHEAFANPLALDPQPGPSIARQPPAPIDEIPPAAMPKGRNVRWIPGYWAWDDLADDFLWVSGVWRDAPPGRRWVPGYWAQGEGGHRWVPGVWVAGNAEAMAYAAYPPRSLERGPSSPSPSRNHLWIPGVWQHQQGQYKWQPGAWVEGRRNWAWVPDHYAWTPRGAVHVRGFWDYQFHSRGTIFAPVRLKGDAAVAAGVRFTPNHVLAIDKLVLQLFAGPERHHYYFGDYYGETGARLGIHPWVDYRMGGRGFDPLLNQYAWQHSLDGRDVLGRLTDWGNFYTNHPDKRPPATLAGLTDLLTRPDLPQGQLAAVTQPLSQLLGTAEGATRLVPLNDLQVRSIVDSARQLNLLGGERLQVEGLVAGVAPAVGTVTGTVGGTLNTTTQVLRLPPLATPVGVPHVLPVARDIVPGVGGLVNQATGTLLPQATGVLPPLPLGGGQGVLPLDGGQGTLPLGGQGGGLVPPLGGDGGLLPLGGDGGLGGGFGFGE